MKRAKKDHKAHLGLISGVVVVGIFGGILVHKYFILAALLFWLIYTAILSYSQFKKKRKQSYKTFTDALANPQMRFFIFEYLAALGILSVFNMGAWVGIMTLGVWWLFSLNFFLHHHAK
jgi:hypothetical protein